MNWSAFMVMLLSGAALWLSGFWYGNKRGHLSGHHCEMLMQEIYEQLDKDSHDT